MNAVNQRMKIVNFCKAHGSITVREAFSLGINSPTKRISELSADPEFVVVKKDIPEYDDDGKWKGHHSEYRIYKSSKEKDGYVQ